MRFLHFAAAVALCWTSALAQKTDDKKEEPPLPCTIRSPNTGSFFDLSSVALKHPAEGKKESKHDRLESWHARGYDYHHNFTINFCSPVLEADKFDDVLNIDPALQRNVSAFYMDGNQTVSIGQQNDQLIIRGRKLVLNYTGGSYCGRGNGNNRTRKSTVLSLLCERDPVAPKAAVAFISTDPEECTYFFEARTFAACPTVNKPQQQLGPAGVFGVIAGIAILVYLVGGIVYQRAVMHQRGWRQLPNHALWAGMANFTKDLLIICGVSCCRCLPGRRGYNRVDQNGRSPRMRGSGGSDDENRLMDQLDEEWED